MLDLTRRRIRNRGKHTILTLIMTAVLVLALTGIGGATPIPGATPTWSASNFSTQVTPTCINFYNIAVGSCPAAATMTLGASDAIFGTPTVTTGTTSDYLIANQSGFTPGTFANYTGGTAFMTLASPGAGFTFDVNQIFVPAGTVCPATSGTPATCVIEDLTLEQQSPTTVLIGLTTTGIGYVTGSNPVTTGSTPFTFTYSTQIPNTTIAQLIAAAANGPIVAQSVSISASGNNVPEPMAFSLMGLGLLAIGGFSRFRRARSQRV